VSEITPRVSVVVATVDRPEALRNCLDGLSRLLDVSCELIVVVGPGGDATIGLLRDDQRIAALIANDERNLSRSRNLGLDQARGEVVAFIDDDAYPSEWWLSDLLPQFDDDEVVAVGGEVFDHTGFTYQARYSRCSRAGDSTVVLAEPLRGLTETPAAGTFDYPIGTNMLIRRSSLEQIGGFDEQFDYYHDETDVARRLLDAGGIVRVVGGGQVFHKFLPSSIRDHRRVALDRRSILTNRAYFAVRHQRLHDDETTLRADFARFVTTSESEIDALVAEGIAGAEVALRHRADVAVASTLLDSWLATPPQSQPHRADPAALRVQRDHILERTSRARRHLVVINEGLPLDLLAVAEQLAAEGHIVRVLEASQLHSTVDLEAGLWRHRLAPADRLAGSTEPSPSELLWLRAAQAVFDELQRIESVLHPIDAVLALESALADEVARQGVQLHQVTTVDDLSSATLAKNLLATTTS